jgi:signal peptidase I
MEDEIKREEADAAEPEVKGAEIDAEQNDNALSKKRQKKRPRSPEEEMGEQIDTPSLDSLLDDDGVILNDESDAKSGFDEFFADYKAVIGRSLAMAKSAIQKPTDDSEEPTEDGGDVTENEPDESESYISKPVDEDQQFSLNVGYEEETPDGDVAIAECHIPIYNPEKPRFIDSVFDFIELFIFTLAAVLFLTTFLFKHAIVEGGSMMNTLIDGEHLIVSDFLYTPERGDIVVFADYSAGQTRPYVKRVIGIPGDKVVVTADGQVTVNGEALEEDYVLIDGSFPAGYYGKECVVPEGEVFVLGDHRNASSDSATFPHTTVKIESILGKVLIRIYPFAKFGTVE